MRAVLAVVLAALVALFAADVRYRGASGPLEPPRATLARVLGDGAPHPTGSVALAAVRARIAEAFRELGAPAEERSAFACGRYGSCAQVHQLVARVPGRDSTGTVLVVAHADSVGASPGASDDGAGVAALLEVARATAHAPPRNDVLFAVLEGEELGLLGAEAFAATDPRSPQVRVVINLEARGSRGPAQLFQTSRGGGTIVALATSAMARPVGSSLFATVYERMPNDTDLTVFLDRGHAGLNFAFSGGVEVYHTAHDDLAHQSEASLAHLTECGQAAVRALGDTDLRTLAPHDTVWFDVLGWFVVAWPSSWSVPLATLGLLGVLAAALVLVRARRVRVSAIALATAMWLGNVLLALLAGVAIVAAVRASGRAPTPWIAHPAPLLVALFGAPIVISLGLARAARERVGPEASALGTALVHALLALVIAQLLPGASYLLVVPSLVAAVSFSLLARRPLVAIALPALAGLFAFVLVLRTLYPGLGLPVAPAFPLVSALVVLPFAPMWSMLEARQMGWGASFGALLLAACTALACTLSPFSVEVPRRVNVMYVEESGASSGIVAVDPTWVGTPWGQAPSEMIAALGPGAREGAPVPWHTGSAWVSPAPKVGLAAPAVSVLEGSRALGRQRVRLRSMRGAPTLVLIVPPDSGLVGVDVEGAVGAPRLFSRGLPQGFRGLRLDGVGAEGVVLSCAYAGGTRELFVVDASSGVPASAGGAITAARPADAVATQDGDRTVVFRRFSP